MSEQNESFGNMFFEFEARFANVIKTQAMIEPMEYLHKNTIALAQEYRKLKAAYIEAVMSIPVLYATELPKVEEGEVVVGYSFLERNTLKYETFAEYKLKMNFAQMKKKFEQHRYLAFVIKPESSQRKWLFEFCTICFNDIATYDTFMQSIKPFLKDKDFFLQQNP